MLTGITTRTSTPQEDAEPWPGGSARPVLAYLTATLGMTAADARDLLKAARTAQAETGPGSLADYPVPGGDAHLLIHYAPGSRAYRFKLTTPENELPPGTNPEPGTAPGNRPCPDGPPGGRETPDGSPAGAGGTPVAGLPAPPRGTAQPGSAEITVTIWHNVAFDDQGRHTAMVDGYQPGDPMVRVFTYQADPAGRPPEEIADEAFAIFNDHPWDSAGADLARAYYGRRLRSLSFPGNSPCCSRPCCLHRRAVWPRSPSRPPGEADAANVSQVQGGPTMTDNISQRPVPSLDPPERFAGGEVVAAARCPVDVSTYPRRHVIVVKHAGERQTFSVHEVAHNHVEWVGGQGHYDLSYADALRRMAEKVVDRA